MPALHKAYLEAMVQRVFYPCTERLEDKLAAAAREGRSLDMEACFSQVGFGFRGWGLVVRGRRVGLGSGPQPLKA